MPFCPECGEQVAENTRFCPKCGQRLRINTINWFERHLNWTMVLAWAGTYVIAFIVGLVAVLTDPYVSDETLGGIGLLIGLTVPIPVGWWVLRKKNRSMWWLLISGSVFFLLLSNKSLTQTEDKGGFKSD